MTENTLRLPKDNSIQNPNPINGDIRAKKVRIVGGQENSANGENAEPATHSNHSGGAVLIDFQAALLMASNRNLDLIQISMSPDGIPVCQIDDFGKFQYNKQKIEQKKQKDQRTAAKKNDAKEIQLSVEIDQHDLKTKINQARAFFKEQRRVKWVLKFKGREMTHMERANVLIDHLKSALIDVAMEGPINKDGKIWSQVWQPKRI